MQLLNMIANQWVYTVYDTAPIPFGDPFQGSATSSTAAAVFTVVGYQSTSGDAVTLSVEAGGFLDTAFTVGKIYYVVSPSTDTFELSATKGGSAVAAVSSTASSLVSVHLVSNQVDGTVIPFKPGNTVVALNLSTYSVSLYGAPDASAPTPGNYTYPTGPGTAAVITTVSAGSAALVQLNYDWIKCSSTAGCILLQN
jgi:hypothetical protein